MTAGEEGWGEGLLPNTHSQTPWENERGSWGRRRRRKNFEKKKKEKIFPFLVSSSSFPFQTRDYFSSSPLLSPLSLFLFAVVVTSPQTVFRSSVARLRKPSPSRHLRKEITGERAENSLSPTLFELIMATKKNMCFAVANCLCSVTCYAKIVPLAPTTQPLAVELLLVF